MGHNRLIAMIDLKHIMKHYQNAQENLQNHYQEKIWLPNYSQWRFLYQALLKC